MSQSENIRASSQADRASTSKVEFERDIRRKKTLMVDDI